MKQKQINISTLSDNVIALQPHRTRRNSQKSRGKSDNLSPAQREWLTRGLAQPGGKLPIFDRDVQKRTSQRGSRYAFVQLSDASGTFETTVFSELLAENVNLLEVGGRPILLKVAARMDEDQLRLTVQSISDLEHATVSAPVLLKIWINDYEPLGDLKSLVEKHTESSKESQGNARISLIIPSETREVEVRLDGAYLYNRQMYDSIKKIPGVIQVQEA